MNPNRESCSVIKIAAGLLIGPDGRTLLVRKRGTQAFMQPGGKIERYEEPVSALVRELLEELRLVIDPTLPVPLGRFMAPAANEPDTIVEAELFLVEAYEDVVPAAEIDAIAWVEPASAADLHLAPLTRDHVLPLYLRLRALCGDR